MSLNVSSSSVNRFNMDWFTFEDTGDKLKYGKVKSEYLDVFYEAREKMCEEQMAACAQAREKLVDLDGLTEEQIKCLSEKYDPKKMTYAEYRSFLDDLCEFGYFAEEDKPLVYGGVVSYLNPRGEAYLTTVSAPPGYDTAFLLKGGDALAWTKYMSSFGTFDPSSGDFEKSTKALLFDKLQDILLQMSA